MRKHVEPGHVGEVVLGQLVANRTAGYAFLLRCAAVCAAWRGEVDGQLRVLGRLDFPPRLLWKLSAAKRVAVAGSCARS